MNDSVIKLIDENGKYVEYKILFTFKCEELNKDYVAFIKDKEEYDENGDMLIYVAYYNPNSTMTDLIPVTDEKELEMANEIIEELKKEENI